jgi:hypothetical protein
MTYPAVTTVQAEPGDTEIACGSLEDLFQDLDVLEVDPLYLHVASAVDVDIPSLCSKAEQALATLRGLERDQAKSGSSRRRQAIGRALAYAGYTLSQARQTAEANGNSAVAAAQLADAVRAMRKAWNELQSGSAAGAIR